LRLQSSRARPAGALRSSLNRIALATNIPVAFGVTPTENIEQAIERAGTKMNNRGAEVAMTALEMINITKSINN